MNYQLKDKTFVELVALKVKDIDKQLAFYRNVLGLDLLSEENGIAFLGFKETKKPLLALLEKEDGIPSETSHNGLFSFSFCLPNRQALGELYKYLLEIDYEIVGMNDHGHSESIYLKDAEFNGIELYWDRDRKDWSYNEDGTVEGVLRRLDSASLLKEAKEKFVKMPVNTWIGNIHLNVSDLETSVDFYTKVLGFQLKNDSFPSMRFLAAGDYHHHIALNIWNRVSVQDQSDENLGLDYISFKMPRMDDLEDLKKHLDFLKKDYYFNRGKKILQIDDPNGIHVWFHVVEKLSK